MDNQYTIRVTEVCALIERFCSAHIANPKKYGILRAIGVVEKLNNHVRMLRSRADTFEVGYNKHPGPFKQECTMLLVEIVNGYMLYEYNNGTAVAIGYWAGDVHFFRDYQSAYNWTLP